ncbi:MAG: hypothetical protein KAG98_07650 [Lentisphaeria bacterium]|nr:hypothetical protein [Lentisphaeria bacterium]
MQKLNLLLFISGLSFLTSCISVYEKLPESPATKPDLVGLRISIEGVRATEKIGASTGNATSSGSMMVGGMGGRRYGGFSYRMPVNETINLTSTAKVSTGQNFINMRDILEECGANTRAKDKIDYTISADVYSKLEKDMDYLMPDVGYYLLSLGSYSRIRRTGRAVYRIYGKDGALISKKSYPFTYGYACVGPTLLGTIWASKTSSTYYPAIRQYVGINAAYRLAEELAELKAEGK